MKKLAPWLAAAALLVIIFGTIYAVVQQAQRNDANWPQIQIAEDTAAALNRGVKPPSLSAGRVDFDKSLATFFVIYDKAGRPVGGTGYLYNRLPDMPFGVLKAAHGQEYSTVTWQPAGEVRVAAVTVEANNYYVLSGRSLKEVEKNEDKSFKLAFIGGLLSAITLVVAYGVVHKPRP